MNIGSLNHRITLQYRTRVSDSMGGYTDTFVDHCTIFAAIWPVSAKETIQANAPTMTVSHRIRIHYRDIMGASWRIKYGDRYFNVVSIINPNEARKYLDIMAKEVKA